MSDPRIREATAHDADTLARVYRSAYRENRRLGLPADTESVTAPEVGDWIREYRVFVATVDGDVVGGVRLEATDPDRATVSRLGVHEDWKEEGIGSRLLTHAEDAAREGGHGTVRLTTPLEHPYLPDLYRRRGYEVTDEDPAGSHDFDMLVMEKRLR